MDLLIVYAADKEVAACNLGPPSLRLGVGKTAAAAGLTKALHVQRPDRVLAVGFCGVYRPSAHGRPLHAGEPCIVGSETFADEGAQTEEGFLDLRDLGLADGDPIEADRGWSEELAQRLGAPIVAGATVSTCSATDRLAQQRAERSRAQIETMEGAAIGWVCREAKIPWAQIRVVSNYCGDRSRADWNLDRAAQQLAQALRVLAL